MPTRGSPKSRADVFYSTRTVKTSLGEPPNQVLRQQGFSSIDTLRQIFVDPRMQSARNARPADSTARMCPTCSETKGKAQFSKAQWTRKGGKESVCLSCVAMSFASVANAEPKEGGRRRAGRKSPSKCFSCGSVGHVAAECPDAAQGPKCYGCGSFGHVKQHCPNGID